MFPRRLERIVRHCLEKNPAERFQSTRDVAFNLEALTDISTASRGGLRAVPEEKSARRWLLPLLAGLLLLASWAGVYRFAHKGIVSVNPTFHEITFRNGILWDARFAPDGQTIVYGAAWDGLPQEIFSTRFDSSDFPLSRFGARADSFHLLLRGQLGHAADRFTPFITGKRQTPGPKPRGFIFAVREHTSPQRRGAKPPSSAAPALAGPKQAWRPSRRGRTRGRRA